MGSNDNRGGRRGGLITKEGEAVDIRGFYGNILSFYSIANLWV